MDEGGSYEPGLALGETMPADLVSEVVTSRHLGFTPGDIVQHYAGWQDHTVSEGAGLRKLDPPVAPVSTALGVLGMPGMTAYVGLIDIARPKSGETLVVAAASGAVGSVVGQIAKLQGCRVVGIAGGEQKCRYVREELGFDVALDHRDSALPEQLAQACPDGIDIYWENVGGPVFQAVLPLLNTFARVPVCGLVSQANATEPPPGPDQSAALMRAILIKRLLVQGFIVDDHWADHWDSFQREMAAWLHNGRIVYREDVTDGFEHAPARFIAMLRGENFGKTLIKV
jgi:NADPH-dependent curcumin reductase CurA